MSSYCAVKKDFGGLFGPPLRVTGFCNSAEKAWAEPDRMLAVWAGQEQSGQPMTKAQSLEIFGGPDGRNVPVLEELLLEVESRGLDLPDGSRA